MPRKTKKPVRSIRKTGAKAVKLPSTGTGSDIEPGAAVSAAESLIVSMSGPLRAEYKRLKSALAAASTKSVTSKHKVALIVLRVKNEPKRYGDGAVVQLEAALGLDAKSLYRWSSVAEAWPSRSSLAEVLARKNGRGLPLTWSHLELLSEIEDRAKRARAIEGALRQSWSVRQLRAWITGLHKSADTKLPEPTSPAKSVENAIVNLVQRADDVRWRVEEWHATLSRLPSGPPSPMVVESLKRAQVVHARLKEACARALEEIAEVLARANPGAIPPPTAPAAPSVAA